MDIIGKEKRMCTCCMEVHDVSIVKVLESLEYKEIDVEFYATSYYCELADEYYESEEMLSANYISMKNAYRDKTQKCRVVL